MGFLILLGLDFLFVCAFMFFPYKDLGFNLNVFVKNYPDFRTLGKHKE